jgi:hypothetical protein
MCQIVLSNPQIKLITQHNTAATMTIHEITQIHTKISFRLASYDFLDSSVGILLKKRQVRDLVPRKSLRVPSQAPFLGFSF